MFQRRKKRNLTQNFREAMWPSMGWARTYLYFKHRVQRLQGTPYYIAAGLATGVAISFVPLIGVQIGLGFLICLAMRASFLAMVVGTAFGNPWTFPFIWLTTYQLGHYMLAKPGAVRVADNLTFAVLRDNPWDIWWPMFVGSLPCALMVWLIVYFPVRDIVGRYQRRRYRKLLKNIMKKKKHQTMQEDEETI